MSGLLAHSVRLPLVLGQRGVHGCNNIGANWSQKNGRQGRRSALVSTLHCLDCDQRPGCCCRHRYATIAATHTVRLECEHQKERETRTLPLFPFRTSAVSPIRASCPSYLHRPFPFPRSPRAPAFPSSQRKP